MYIPRAFFNIWMEERLILLLAQIKKIDKKIPITFEIKDQTQYLQLIIAR